MAQKIYYPLFTLFNITVHWWVELCIVLLKIIIMINCGSVLVLVVSASFIITIVPLVGIYQILNLEKCFIMYFTDHDYF